MTKFFVMVVNVFSAYTGFSHFFVGITLIVWGECNMEMLNLAVAINKGYEETGFIAVVSSVVLCLTLVIPAACISRMIKLEQYEILILQQQHTRYHLIVPVMLVTVIAMVCFTVCNMHLNRRSALFFIAIYTGYLVFSFTVLRDAT